MKSGHKGQIKSPSNPPKPGSMGMRGAKPGMARAKMAKMGKGKMVASDYADQSMGHKG